ncbi:MAG: hypothetical protein RXO36_02215 [Candidatus Nanopusillus acidilobi]
MTNHRPIWHYGNIVSSPASGSVLASFTVPNGYIGYIFGFSISLSDTSGNQFYINWVSNGINKTLYLVASGPGTIFYESDSPLNEGLPADPNTIISITNINAGSGNYFAGLKISTELG